jgi:hydroxymethylpyrimidine/phosphomethylpyrimidine kinase
MPLKDAVSQAKRYVTAAIREAFPMGRGHGPLNHFHAHWE